MSGNSFGTEACQWIADNVFKHCINIEKVDLSDIFTKRLRSDLPNSLLLLMTALEGKKIKYLDLSHNAFGPDGVKSF
jgi:Ran GTPase-activating protein 1